MELERILELIKLKKEGHIWETKELKMIHSIAGPFSFKKTPKTRQLDLTKQDEGDRHPCRSWQKHPECSRKLIPQKLDY